MDITLFSNLSLEHGLAVVVGYLFGAIPFGIVIARLFGLGDLRQIGSGNIGATNVLRTGNKLAALLTLLLDSGKGAIVVVACALLATDPNIALIGGFMAVIGHNFPVWLKFKGGKGVATTLGALLAINWMMGLAVCAVWLSSALILRYSSLAALMGLGLAPVFAWYLAQDDNIVLIALMLAVLAYIRHHENIRRLIGGTETKIGKK